MIGEKLIEKKLVTLGEVKEILSARKKEKELNYEQDIALKYAKKFSKLTTKQAEKVREELSKIESLTDDLVVKIMDLLPIKKETVELVIPKGGEVGEEDIKKILEITKKYNKE